MSGVYRERPDGPKHVILHEPFPRSATMVFVVQLLLMAGGLVSTTLSGGHRTTLSCNHIEETCAVVVDDRTTSTIPLANVVEARVVSEPLSTPATGLRPSTRNLSRLGLFLRDGSTTTVGAEPHDSDAVAQHARLVQGFLADSKAPSLWIAVDVGTVRPSFATFAAIAAILFVPLALLLALRRSARVEVDPIERSLRIVRRRGPFPLRSTRLRLDDLRAALLESKPGARLAYRVVLEKKNVERVALVDGWSPHEASQKKTIASITAWIES